MASTTLEAYDVSSWPTVRVLGPDGTVTGRDMNAVEQALGGS